MTTVDLPTNIDALVERAARRLSPRDPWLNAKEAAARCRLSLDNFLRRCRGGRGPACSGHGRLMRFRTTAVDAWVGGGFK
jgi:Helix-turn-helix domain